MARSLTAEDAAVLFLDHQEEIVKHSVTQPLAKLRRSAGVLAKLAALHRLPALLSVIPSGGEVIEEVLAPLGRPAAFTRTTTSAFEDETFVAALKATKRRVLILGGVVTEIVVVRSTLAALEAGYDVHVAVDACGGVDPRTEDAVWRRLIAAGATTSAAVTIVAELVDSFTTERGGAALGLIYELLGG